MTTSEAVPELPLDPDPTPTDVSLDDFATIKLIVRKDADSTDATAFTVAVETTGIPTEKALIEVLEVFLATLKEPKQDPKQ